MREVHTAFAPRPAPAPPPRPRAPAANTELLEHGGRRRLVLVELGELRTRAHGYDVTDAARPPILVGRVECESAVLRGELPDRVGAPRGLRTATSERAEAPAVIACPSGVADAWLLVGQGAATLGGHEALVAADASEARLEGLLYGVLFPLVRAGDQVEVVVVDAPNAAQAPLAALLARWDGAPRTITGLCREEGAVEARSFDVRTARVPAGHALLELGYERGLLVEEGAPALFLDLGHRNSRLYLMDFATGLIDLDVIPHGGRSFLEHARRYAEERGWRPGGDVDLLRQLDDGTDMLSFGGMSFMTRQFFALPQEELVKAIVASVAARLRHHVEQGGRWPHALCLTGGPARALSADLAQRLAARGMAIPEVAPLAPRPSPSLEGALHAWGRGLAQGLLAPG